jgi:hypothetical protein
MGVNNVGKAFSPSRAPESFSSLKAAELEAKGLKSQSKTRPNALFLRIDNEIHKIRLSPETTAEELYAAVASLFGISSSEIDNYTLKVTQNGQPVLGLLNANTIENPYEIKLLGKS